MDQHEPGVPSGLGPHVFVDDLAAPELSDVDRHHLEGPLRLRPGDSLTICDGAGSWSVARFGAEIEVTGPTVFEPSRGPEITIAFAPIKGDRCDLVVQKLAELGVDTIIPISTDHGVVRWNRDRGTKQVERFRRIAREASMQSKRCRLPRIEHLKSFDEAIQLPGAVGADRGGGPPSLDRPVVLVGPEGGWSPSERSRLPGRIAVADNVLRAETASIAVAAVLVAKRGGLA